MYHLLLIFVFGLLLSLEPPPLGIIFKVGDPDISAKPLHFTKVAYIGKRGPEEVFIWYPVAPAGYVSVGCLVTLHDEAPSLESVCCPIIDLVSQANIPEAPLSKSSSSKAPNCWSIWKVENHVSIRFKKLFNILSVSA